MGLWLTSSTRILYCPIYSAEIDEEVLAAHGFRSAENLGGTPD